MSEPNFSSEDFTSYPIPSDLTIHLRVADLVVVQPEVDYNDSSFLLSCLGFSCTLESIYTR